MCYVIIADELFVLADDADFREAQQALRAANLVQTPIYVGDPDCPDSYANGQWLFA